MTLRVRASQPGTLVQVTLLEVMGGRRLAADTVGAVLPDRGWRRVEVTHDAHLPGAALAIEVVLPRGSPRATVLVDGLEVGASRTHRIRWRSRTDEHALPPGPGSSWGPARAT